VIEKAEGANRQQDDSGFVSIPVRVWRAFLEGSIVAADLKVYTTVFQLCGTRASNQELGEACGMHPNSVSRSVSRLSALGHLEPTVVHDAAGTPIGRKLVPALEWFVLEDGGEPSDEGGKPTGLGGLTCGLRGVNPQVYCSNNKMKGNTEELPIRDKSAAAKRQHLSAGVSLGDEAEEPTVEALPDVSSASAAFKSGWRSVKAKYSRTYQGRVEAVARKIADGAALNAQELVTGFKWMADERGYTVPVYKKSEHQIREILKGNPDIGDQGLARAMVYYLDNHVALHQRMRIDSAYPSLSIFIGYISQIWQEVSSGERAKERPGVV